MSVAISRDAFLSYSLSDLTKIYRQCLDEVFVQGADLQGGGERREKREHASESLCVLGRTPAGAELAISLMNNR